MNSKFVLLCVFVYVCNSFGHKLSIKHVSEFLDEESVEEHWAFLAVGSNGWENYRHQADACHAYQILRKHGMPADRIIVMMYDDVANSTENPTPGILINDINGPDVYAGVQIDYRGEDVTPENFLHILSGNELAMDGVGTGRVIKSNPNNHVFVNFVDHGGKNTLWFVDRPLRKDIILDTLKTMHKDNKFGKMIMYVEACDAGTIFRDLSPNLNVYVTTASNTESSYSYCWDNLRNTPIGDLFSVNWMADSENLDFSKETFQTQYENVRVATTASPVMQWGDLTLARNTLDGFIGHVGAPIDHSFDRPPVTEGRVCDVGNIPQDKVELASLEIQLRRAETELAKIEFRRKIKEYKEEKLKVLYIIRDIESKVQGKSDEADDNDVVVDESRCYDAAYELMSKRCFNLKKHFNAKNMLNNLCGDGIPIGIIELSIMEACIN